MSEIVLGDLLHWQRGLGLVPATEEDASTVADRPVSWAVSLRASAPVLPPLRGGEIVIAPPRILEQARDAEMIDHATLLRQLADQPIAALMVEPSFSEGRVDGVTLLVTAGAFPHDVESNLNRLITERRAELFRLGSELSRMLSNATLSGAGIDTLLDAAASLIHRPMVLFDGRLSVLGRSSTIDDGVRLSKETVDRLPRVLRAGVREVVDTEGRRWLGQRFGTGMASTGDAGTGLLLLLAHHGDGSTEIDRLVLSQVGSAVDLLLRHSGGIEAIPRGRASREPLLADLLLGRLASRDAAEARARLLGIDPTGRVRVALVSGDQSLIDRARSLAPDDRGRISAMVAIDQLAIVMVGEEPDASLWRSLSALVRERSSPSAVMPMLVLSDPAAGAAHLPNSLDQVRTIERLMRAGRFAGSAIRASEIDRLGIAGLLLPLVGSRQDRVDAGEMRDRMDAFASTMLRALEDHDTRRGSELVSTLAAFLDLGGALAQAADQLGVHRNTLSYRLNRIAELTERDLNDPQTRVLLQIALAIRALQRAAVQP